MGTSERHFEILRIARRENRVTVEDLAEQLGVSAQTIRRDLSDLADKGQLDRMHGGATLSSGTRNIAYEARRALNDRAKADIAEAAAALVPAGASVFLNIGTTTEAVARALAHRPGLMVVSNNLNVAAILGQQGQADVILTGGALRAADNGLVGPDAASAVGRYRADLAIIGCSALDAGGTLLDFDADEVAVSRAMLAHARRTVLVADRSKFHRKAPVVIAALPDLDAFVTDAPLPPLLGREAPAWGTQIVVAS